MAANEDDSPDSADKRSTPKRDRPPRTPVTIDLEAEEVAAKPAAPDAASETAAETAETAGVAETQEPASDAGTPEEPVSEAAANDKDDSPPAEPPVAVAVAPRGPSFAGMVAAGVIGALVALLIGYGLQAGGILPAPGGDTASAALQKANAASGAIAALDKRVADAESTLSGLKAASGDASGLAGRVTGLEADQKALADKVAGLGQAAPAESGTNGGADMSAVLDDLTARVDALENSAGSGAAADTTAIDGLKSRLGALEAKVQGLSSRLDTLVAAQSPSAASDKAARAIAIATLRQAAAKGGAFAGDLAMAETLGLAPGDLAALKPLAEKGAPSVAALADGFPAVADKILAASDTAGPNAGILARMLARAKNLVTVRPVAPIPGNSAEAIVSRMSAAVRGGDLAKALAEREALPEPAKIVSSVWASAASDRVTIDKLVDKISASAAGGGN